jgi:RNA polymerase sigma factor (sigma-70 family)
MNGSPDDLARRIAQGEDLAFSEFASRYSALFYSFLRRYGLHDAAAQELACNCITDVALKVRDHYTPGTNFNAWVFTLLRRAAFTWYRKEKRLDVKDLPDSPSNPVPERLVASARALQLGEFLNQLEQVDQDIIRLRYGGLETPSFPAIAEELSIPNGKITPENVRQRHARALKKLKRLLDGVSKEESNE